MSSAADVVPVVSANRRILARLIDVWVLGFVGVFVILLAWTALIGPISEDLSNNNAFSSWLAMASMMLLDPLCTKLWSRTPGKAILGLRVTSTTGAPLTWGQVWRRSLLVWIKGLALGIPLVWLITAAVAMRRVAKTGSASWDLVTETKVESARAA